MRLFVTLLLALCVLAQTLALVMSLYRARGRDRYVKTLPELLLLALILLCSVLYGQALNSFVVGLISPVGFGKLHFTANNPAFAWIFLAALLLLLTRGVWVCLRRARGIRTGISALSVKNAIDSMHSGVLFSGPDGFIQLSNAQMQKLMAALTGRVHRSGSYFYELLASGDLRPGCRKTEFEGQIVCLLPDGAAWMFTRAQLRIRRREYIQLTAADITERWELTAQLQRQNEQLRRRSEELKGTIANLHTLSGEREAQKAKMRAHDILGQRLTLLLRTVRNERDVRLEQTMDYDLLRSLSQGLLDELKESQSAPTPQDFLDSLRHEFGSVGVEIRLEGAFPEDSVKGRLLADIIRESVTNAVRHGFATAILIRLGRSGSGWRMEITNNGPPPGTITEGGGLSGIRKKLEPHGGALRVATQPRFTLMIDLPGGSDCV